MGSTTLTSLAMLKVNVDSENRDYLEYLRPFLQEVLRELEPGPVTEQQVCDGIRDSFGLYIPSRVVMIVLKRLARSGLLKRKLGEFHYLECIPDPGIAGSKAAAQRHIESVIAKFMAFTESTSLPVSDEGTATRVLLAFLSEFSIDCLRTYLRGTALPKVVSEDKELVVVSKFVEQLARFSPERFESFVILVKGHMLANALLCPDLASVPKSFAKLSLYLDTPIVIRALGLEGDSRQQAGKELMELVKGLGGSFRIFTHTRDEIEKVIKGAADHLDMEGGRGAIVAEMRRQGKKRSDLYMMTARLDTLLADLGITIRSTPKYEDVFQIDELAFEEALADEVAYYNPRAREYDINSVRSIYELRKGLSPRILERAHAVLVTSNSGFARAAYRYGRDIEESRAVSSVIADFSLANIAWLKAPLGAPDLPAKEVLAYCYAAMQPTPQLWQRFVDEADQLEKQGDISPEDHQVLRFDLRARDEMMNLTLGDEDALSPELVRTVLDRVEAEIRAGDIEKLDTEMQEHGKTRDRLNRVQEEFEDVQKSLFWFSRRVASVSALVCSLLLASAVLAGSVAGLSALVRRTQTWIRIASPVGLLIIMALLLNLINNVFGYSVRDIHERIRDWLQTRMYRLMSGRIPSPEEGAAHNQSE